MNVLAHTHLEEKHAEVEVLRVTLRYVAVLVAEDRTHALVHALLAPDPARNCAIEISSQSLVTLSRMDLDGKKMG